MLSAGIAYNLSLKIAWLRRFHCSSCLDFKLWPVPLPNSRFLNFKLSLDVIMIVSIVLMVQEVAIRKCFKENYLDFMTKLFMDNILPIVKHIWQTKIS